jgi:3-oxoacyl-[acyl-carrier protein] reductase
MVGIDLAGRVALVTGGSRGLGRAAALALARAGADVAVNYRRDARAAVDVAKQCEELGVRSLAVKADVAASADVKLLFEAAELELGRLDILVANAGIWKGAAIEKMTDRQLSEMLDINVKGVFSCCREAVPLMRKSGGGRMILVASTAGQRGEAFHSHYAASKGAVISLTKSLAPELAADQILVNCIAPGWFDTDMSRPSLGEPEVREQVLATIPLGRVGRPEEFAGAVLFLASELSTFVTGEILNVNGGAVLVG